MTFRDLRRRWVSAVMVGLCGAAVVLALAAVVAARGTGGVTLVVVPTDRDVEQVTADARFFLAGLEGASDAEAARLVAAAADDSVCAIGPAAAAERERRSIIRRRSGARC